MSCPQPPQGLHPPAAARCLSAASSAAEPPQQQPQQQAQQQAPPQQQAHRVGRLNHVAVAVPDLAAAAEQYRRVLGAEVGAPGARAC